MNMLFSGDTRNTKHQTNIFNTPQDVIKTGLALLTKQAQNGMAGTTILKTMRLAGGCELKMICHNELHFDVYL